MIVLPEDVVVSDEDPPSKKTKKSTLDINMQSKKSTMQYKNKFYDDMQAARRSEEEWKMKTQNQLTNKQLSVQRERLESTQKFMAEQQEQFFKHQEERERQQQKIR